MPELETQVAKIHLGDTKQANSYIFVLAEKINASDSELYVICELPLFNPAAQDECERIANAIAASLRRIYKKSVNDNTFENALAQINDELGKLASMGKTHWIGKLNSIIAIKRGTQLSVASVGKISGLLFRDGNFASIADTSPASHPLKTFEHFAVGKLKASDLLILSTTQLFNHISVDRIKSILLKNDLPGAAKEIIKILQDNIGPEIACGTILALLEEASGKERDEEVDLHSFTSPPKVIVATSTLAKAQGLSAKVKEGAAVGVAAAKALVKNPPKFNFRNVLSKNKQTLGLVQDRFKQTTQQFSPSKFKTLSRQKKFFLISAAVLLIALITNIILTQYYKKQRTQTESAQAAVTQLQQLANDADSALIFGDEAKARDLLAQLQEGLKTAPTDNEDIKKVQDQVADIQSRLEKKITAEAQVLGTLANTDHLISLPGYLAAESNRTITSYNRSSGNISDSVLHISEPIVSSTFLKGNQAVVYNGSELFLWNIDTGVLVGSFTDQVPARDNAVGLRAYSTNSRVYILDKQSRRVMSFAAGANSFSKPTVSISNTGDVSSASDLAIDGNIYIVTGGTILKFNSGKQQEFKPAFTGSLSNTARIYTESGFNNIYILDSGNKRILVLDKGGNLAKTIVSPQLTDPKDFSVDEKGKSVFILNGGELLKINL